MVVLGRRGGQAFVAHGLVCRGLMIKGFRVLWVRVLRLGRLGAQGLEGFLHELPFKRSSESRNDFETSHVSAVTSLLHPILFQVQLKFRV